MWIALTHNLTHTAKEVDGISGADRMESIIFPEQKGPETAGCQRFPGYLRKSFLMIAAYVIINIVSTRRGNLSCIIIWRAV